MAGSTLKTCAFTATISLWNLIACGVKGSDSCQCRWMRFKTSFSQSVEETEPNVLGFMFKVFHFHVITRIIKWLGFAALGQPIWIAALSWEPGRFVGLILVDRCVRWLCNLHIIADACAVSLNVKNVSLGQPPTITKQFALHAWSDFMHGANMWMLPDITFNCPRYLEMFCWTPDSSRTSSLTENTFSDTVVCSMTFNIQAVRVW